MYIVALTFKVFYKKETNLYFIIKLANKLINKLKILAIR